MQMLVWRVPTWRGQVTKAPADTEITSLRALYQESER
jgi:hypothetical protein